MLCLYLLLINQNNNISRKTRVFYFSSNLMKVCVYQYLDWDNICVHSRYHLPRGSWSLRAWGSGGWPGRHPGGKLLGRRVQGELLGVGVQTGLVQVRGRRRHASNGTLQIINFEKLSC